MEWTTKTSMAEKNKKRKLEAVKNPSRAELLADLSKLAKYCKQKGVSVDTQARISKGDLSPDMRDLRSVPKAERVPRVLEKWGETPPRYWAVDL